MARTAEPAGLRLLKGRGGGTDSGGRKVEPTPGFARITPNPPSWLSREAAAEWRRVVPELSRLDIIKAEDRALLAAYCETWSVFVQATRLVQSEGLTIQAAQGQLPHPGVGIARNAARELRALAGHFGLTPSTEKAVARSGDDGSEDGNPFAG